MESAEAHVDVLRGMADVDAEVILLDSLVRGDKRRDDFNATRDGWKHGDMAAMLAEEKRERDQKRNPDVDRRRDGTLLRSEQRDRPPAEKGLQDRAVVDQNRRIFVIRDWLFISC